VLSNRITVILINLSMDTNSHNWQVCSTDESLASKDGADQFEALGREGNQVFREISSDK
jgi:hypothetical protein